MINHNLLIFQTFISIILKFFSISYQSGATALSLNAHNLVICLSKILILPTLLNSSGRTKKFIVIGMLLLSTHFYSFSILSAVIINAVLLNILSAQNTVKDNYLYSFVYRVGSLIGIGLISLIALMPISICYFTKSIIMASLIFPLYYFFLRPEMDKVDQVESRKRQSTIELFKNAYKYKDVIYVYMLLSVLGLIQSNAAFLSGNHNKALIPCMALLVLNIKNKKLSKLMIVISAVISQVFIDGLPLFLLSYVAYKLSTEIKIHAKEKYGDAFIPHVTSHLICDTIMSLIHASVIVYYLI